MCDSEEELKIHKRETERQVDTTKLYSLQCVDIFFFVRFIFDLFSSLRVEWVKLDENVVW